MRKNYFLKLTILLSYFQLLLLLGNKRRNSNTDSHATRKKSSVSEANDSEPEIRMYFPSRAHQETELQSPTLDDTNFHLSPASISSALVESMSWSFADMQCSMAPLVTVTT